MSRLKNWAEKVDALEETFGKLFSGIVFASVVDIYDEAHRLRIQSLISESVASCEKRCPGSQFPPVALALRSVSLVPSPEECEVQNGMTVLLPKSTCLTNESTTQAETPHQIG